MQFIVLNIPPLPTLPYGEQASKRHSLTFILWILFTPWNTTRWKIFCVGGTHNLRVFVAAFNHVFQEVPALQIPMKFFYCLGIPGAFLKSLNACDHTKISASFFKALNFTVAKLKTLNYRGWEPGLIKRKSESIVFKTPPCMRVLTVGFLTLDGQKYYAGDFGQRTETMPRERSVQQYRLTGKSGFSLMNGIRSKNPKLFPP